MVQPRLLEAPCAGRDGELPEGCPGWCEYSDPDSKTLFFDGPTIPERPKAGTKLPGPIQLLRPIGEGAMGTVFEGWDEARREEVAVKFLSSQWVTDPKLRGRFLTEARALSRLRNPHVVPLRQFGQHQGVPYLVMDFIRGVNLEERMLEKIPFDEAFSIVESMARGLAAVHDAGMLHNDVKPGNVIIGLDGHVTLVDFGLARPFASVCRLEPGSFSGTPVYMAPEIIGGWVDAPSPASDLYALGIVAFELFTGRVPFDHENTDAVLNMQMHHDAPRLRDVAPELPRGLDDLVAWCLDKEPYQRIPSAGTFARRLRDLKH